MQGIPLFDLILLGIVVYLFLRLIRSRRDDAPGSTRPGADEFGRTDRADLSHRQSRPDDPSGHDAADDPDTPNAQDDRSAPRYRAAQNAWEALKTPPRREKGQPAPAQPRTYGPTGAPQSSGNFDENEFLRGAKLFYTRLQESWDRRDLADIRQFTDDAMYHELESRARQETPGQTEIVLLEAALDGLDTSGGRTVARVRYEALLRDDPKASAPHKANEVWSFARDERDPGSTWKLVAMDTAA